jgi:hypothetical protein
MIVRSVQLRLLEGARREAFVERAARHFATHFPAATVSKDWRPCVERSLERAEHVYKLKLEGDLYLFLDLCGSFGWDFDLVPGNTWMRAALLNQSITSAGGRIRLLVRLCQKREEIACRNEDLRESFARK